MDTHQSNGDVDGAHSATKSVAERAAPYPKECMSCRIVGSGTLAGVGTYALWQARTVAPGTPVQKRLIAGLGVCLLAGSVLRWRQTAS